MAKENKKPKKAVHKQVGVKKEQKEIHHPPKHDELGNVIEEERTEIVEIEVPIMGTVYEELTDEELEAMEEMEDVPVPKSLEEVVADLFKRVEELEKKVEELAKKTKP